MRALVLPLLLAACVAAPAPDPAPVALFRAPQAPIWSAAALDPARLAGGWTQAADMRSPGAPTCAPGALRMAPAPGGLAVTGQLCLNGRTVRLAGLARPAGPGRLQVPGMETWWILWADEGVRTLAVGTPSGRFGLILDRGRLPADRLAAAARIFDFNGYPAGRLARF
jgi:apolipoprotein D and lipocalin family protein